MEQLRTFVENSIGVGDEARFAFPGPQEPHCDPASLKGHDEAVQELTVEDLVSVGRAAVEELGKRHPDVVIDASVKRSFAMAQTTCWPVRQRGRARPTG